MRTDSIFAFDIDRPSENLFDAGQAKLAFLSFDE
jgi:hypothetical protein